ncbi:MAG: hypothetical protein EBZ49_03660 [Proteobacteria bacterium]|nr:hypothetical protein [Pseudomonadota bacterium]
MPTNPLDQGRVAFFDLQTAITEAFKANGILPPSDSLHDLLSQLDATIEAGLPTFREEYPLEQICWGIDPITQRMRKELEQ